MSNIVTVSDDTFTSEVIESSKPILVDFWATWCGPCKMIAPVLEEIADANSDKITIAKVDVDKNPNVARDYQIMSIPTMMLFSEGKPVKTIMGAKPKAAILRELADVLE
ncbi:thioredoxin [Gordonia shandongensis]|uniref:thioredoxin n=1 Tax=Gordonia shandongensis TaxID=376351 RepID=UPI0003F8E8E0|nr:thioredoxin [Gordonia shandongensis]